MRKGAAIGAIVALLANGCGLMHASRPLPKGMASLEASLGGGVFQNLGTPIPVPISTVGVRYGMTDSVNVDGHVHGTAAAFGVAGLDLGTSGVLMDTDDPAYPLPIVGVSANILVGSGEFRLYPEGFMLFSHQFEDWWLFYGADFLFDPFVRADTNDSGPVMASVLTGSGLKLGDDGHWGLVGEVRWLAADASSLYNTVNWADVGGYGTVGVLIGVQKWFDVDGE